MKKCKVIGLVAFLCICAAPAFADVSLTSAPNVGSQVPQSVWQVGSDGVALHLQSQWQCPAAYDGFARHDLHLYDAFGLDVSCDYRSPVQGEITLYLTKRTGGDLNASFESAKQALLQRPDNAGAVPLPGKDQKTFPSNRSWLHTVYANSRDTWRTGVWYAWFGDWEFEIRATYPSSEEDSVMTMLAHMTSDAANNAGAHLERCAKSAIPVRDGKLVTDEDKQMQGGLALSVTAAAKTDVVEKGGLQTKDTDTPTPSEWCAEDSVQSGTDPILLWHEVSAKGETGSSDRVSLMTYGPPPVLESSADPLSAIFFELKPEDAPAYAITLTSGDETFLLGMYNGRPDGNALVGILSDWVHNRAKPLSSYNSKTKKINIYMPKKD
jgi:hypothetical protein